MTKDRRPRLKKVRCLGPIRKPHSFLTADPKTNRICERCRKRLGQIKVSPLFTQPVEDPRL